VVELMVHPPLLAERPAATAQPERRLFLPRYVQR
jgi:hypothetical protein